VLDVSPTELNWKYLSSFDMSTLDEVKITKN